MGMTTDTPASGIEQGLEDLRNGSAIVLIDSFEDPGDARIVIPAQFSTPVQINSLRKSFGCTELFLGMTAKRGLELGLADDALLNDIGAPLAAFSIRASSASFPEAKAIDDARTIAVAVNSSCAANDITSPGNVFPLIVQDGGVLTRPGHAEAAIDLMRLAGLMPAAVLTIAGRPEGSSMAGWEMPEGARQNGLTVVAVSQVVAYRRTREKLVECVIRSPFDNRFGHDFEIRVYRDLTSGTEHIALVRGNVTSGRDTLVRIHQLDMTADIFRFRGAHPEYVPFALKALAEHDGPAVGLFLQDPDPASMSSLIKLGRSSAAASSRDRDYGVAAQILKDMGVGRMVLLTSSLRKMAAIRGFGLEVVERRPMVREGRERFLLED